MGACGDGAGSGVGGCAFSDGRDVAAVGGGKPHVEEPAGVFGLAGVVVVAASVIADALVCAGVDAYPGVLGVGLSAGCDGAGGDESGGDEGDVAKFHVVVLDG